MRLSVMKSDISICDGGREFSILGGEMSVPPLSASKIIFTFYNLQTYLMIKILQYLFKHFQDIINIYLSWFL